MDETAPEPRAEATKPERLRLPPSPTRISINLVGMFAALYAIWWLRESGDPTTLRTTGVIVVSLAMAVPIIVLEWGFLKPWRNASSGLDFSQKEGNIQRTAVKLLGFGAVLVLAGIIYWLFPEYQGTFYEDFLGVVKAALPYWLALAVPYFYFVDRAMIKPKDGYWHLGTWLLSRSTPVDRRVIGQLLLGWLVKLFFLPLMFTFLGNNLVWLDSFQPDRLMFFIGRYDLLFVSLFTVDLLFVTVGYMATFRIFDSHIRSTEPTLLGWLVALMAYQPIWTFVGDYYLNYGNGKSWFDWFPSDHAFHAVWGSIIVGLIAIYVWATVVFGIRFSNLTHRGIITNGPFRFTKHPAYVSKNLSWWMISMPFMITTTWTAAVAHCMLLLLLNFMYFMRARTEERHLSWDPVYMEYAAYIDRHGIFAWVGRTFPILKFKPGKLFNLKT